MKKHEKQRSINTKHNQENEKKIRKKGAQLINIRKIIEKEDTKKQEKAWTLENSDGDGRRREKEQRMEER